MVSITPAKRQRPNVGTSITLTDFFYNMPVRRRTMQEAVELERIKKAVESIALVHPSVAFTVRNSLTGKLVLQTHKTNSVLSNFGLLFAGDKVGAMKNVNISHSKYKITGFISTQTHHNNSLQFIYVNCRAVRKTPLHTCVHNLLSNSLLMKKKPARKGNPSNSSAVSPTTRLLDKHPVYVLLIECPRSEYDICLEPAKTIVEFKHWDKLLALMTSLTKKFLNDNHLYIGSSKAPHNFEIPTTSVMQPSIAEGSTRISVQPPQQSRACNDDIEPQQSRACNGDIEPLCSSEIDRNPSSHSFSVSEHTTSPSVHTNTLPFDLSTYQNKPKTSVGVQSTVVQQSPSFLVPYNSPSPKNSSCILSRIHSKNCKPMSLKLTVFSPLHSSTISTKLADLTKDTLSEDSQTSPPHHPYTPSTAVSTSTSEQRSSSTLDVAALIRPPRQAPHLPPHLLPPLKTQKLLAHTHSTGPALAYSLTSARVKWRNAKQSDKENVNTGSFDTLLENWKNPTFQPGPEVIAYCTLSVYHPIHKCTAIPHPIYTCTARVCWI